MFRLNMLNKKRVLSADGSSTNSEIMIDNKSGNKHMKMDATSVTTYIPVVIDVEDGEIDGSEKENDILGGVTDRSQLPVSTSGGQQSLHSFLKAELSKLCKALKFSEDVLHMVQRLLEYPPENFNVNKENTPLFQAFQMSLCWIAADILGQKVDRKSLLLEARRILNFECPETLADHVYKKLTPLKKTVQQLHVEDEVEILDLEQYEEQRDKYDGAKNHEKLRKLRKHCEKRKLKLRQKHEEEVREFHKAWKEKRDKIVEEHQAELAVFTVVDNPSATKMGKLTEDTNRFFAAIKDLECSTERERQVLDTKHVAEIKEERMKRQKWFAVAKGNHVRGQSTTINSGDMLEFVSHNDNSRSTTSVKPIVISIDDAVSDVYANVETGPVPVSATKQLDAANVSVQNPKDFAAAEVTVNCQIVDEIPSTKRNTKADSLFLGNHRGSLLEDVPSTGGMASEDFINPLDLKPINVTDNGTTGEQSVLCPKPVVSPHEHDVSADLPSASVSNCQVVSERSDPCVNIVDSTDMAGGPDEIRASEQASGDPNHVDEGAGELHKQPAIENEDDSMLLSFNNSIDSRDDTDLHTACGTGHEPVDKLSDSSRNHQVAGNGAEFQNAAFIQNSSKLVSPETESRDHPILPPAGSIDDEPNNDLFVNFQNHVSLSGALPLLVSSLSEPLQREFEKLSKEKEQANKLHEDTKSQLDSELQKELQEMRDRIRNKFTTKLSDEEKLFSVKTSEFEANHNKLLMNRLLAQAFRRKCLHFISSGSSDVVQPGTPVILQQHQLLPSSQSSPVASFGQSATVNPLYSGYRYPVFGSASASASASTQSPIIQHTRIPMHSRPPLISIITSTIGSARAGGSIVRAAAPHLQPFKPPL